MPTPSGPMSARLRLAYRLAGAGGPASASPPLPLTLPKSKLSNVFGLFWGMWLMFRCICAARSLFFAARWDGVSATASTSAAPMPRSSARRAISAAGTLAPMALASAAILSNAL